MKRFFYIAIVVLTLVPLPLMSQEGVPTYRVAVSPSLDDSAMNDILCHLNDASKGYLREVTREEASLNLLKQEKTFEDNLGRGGLLNSNAVLRPMKWDPVDILIRFESMKQNGENINISVIPLSNGNIYRVPILSEQPYSEQPHLIAKSTLLRIAEIYTDKQQQNAFKKQIEAYFDRFSKTKLIDFSFHCVFVKDKAEIPTSISLGMSIPLSQQVFFSTILSSVYFSDDYYNLSAGLGFDFQTAGDIFHYKFFPSIALYAGYTESILSTTPGETTFTGGPFIEPRLSLGYYINPKMKIAGTVSCQLCYFPAQEQFSLMTFMGIKTSIGF